MARSAVESSIVHIALWRRPHPAVHIELIEEKKGRLEKETQVRLSEMLRYGNTLVS